MRPIHLVKLEKTRPAVVLTRQRALSSMSRVTVAPITSTVKGLRTEVPVGVANGLEQDSAVSCDNLATVPVASLGRPVGFLLDEQEAALAAALVSAFDLRVEELE